MINPSFDKRMKEMAHKERWTASTQAQSRLESAMHTGARSMVTGARKRKGARVALCMAAAAAVLLAVLFVQPPTDLTGEGTVLSSAGLGPTPVPVTVPQGRLDLMVENRAIKAEATFSNHTGDIWLISWNADPAGNVRTVQEPTDLIWLETGITFTDHASWTMLSPWEAVEQQPAWQYQGYRVTADVLHWIEGEWLMPGSEGYEEQQMLIEDAFANGALILAPGDWPEGTSGEMQLVVPDTYQREHPDVNALRYYTQNGLLELAVVESQPVPVR